MRTIVIATLLLGLPVAAVAQETAEGRLSVDVSVRSRAEMWNWFGDDEGGDYAYLGSTARLGLAQQWSGIGWHAEVAAPVLLGLPSDAVESAPRGQAGVGATYYGASGGHENVAGLFLKQAYLRLGGGSPPGHALRLGRFEFVEGAEVAPTNPTLAAVKSGRVANRLLGQFGWSHVGRSLDGAHYAYTSPGWNGTAVIARPTQGVFDVDGWPGLDIAVGYGSLTRRDSPENAGEARLFLLQYSDLRDWTEVTPTDNRPLAVRAADTDDIHVSTLGGHYLRAVETGMGTLDVMLWAAVQGGSWGEQDHRAWAGDVEVGWQPPILPGLRPWLRFGHFRSSGDEDLADGRHETFFQVLPTPRIYARTPFYNLMNLRDTFATLTLRPASGLAIRADVRRLGLQASEDLWYLGGGAFKNESFGFAGRPGTGSGDLATLFDVGVDYRLSSSLAASLYWGYAAGDEVIEAIYPENASGSLGYLELRWGR